MSTTTEPKSVCHFCECQMDKWVGDAKRFAALRLELESLERRIDARVTVPTHGSVVRYRRAVENLIDTWDGCAELIEHDPRPLLEIRPDANVDAYIRHHRSAARRARRILAALPGGER